MLNLKIEDVNDNRPKFQPSLYLLNLNVYQFNKELPLIQLLAIDEDLSPYFGTVRYSLVNKTSVFQIDSKNGTLFFNVDLSQINDLPNFLELHVIAIDQAGLSSLEPVKIFQKNYAQIKF